MIDIYTHSKSGMHISMDTFVQRFQPQRYSVWLNGDDFGFHPAANEEYLPAPVPTIQDVLIKKHNKTVPQSVLDYLRHRNAHHARFQQRKNLSYAQPFPDLSFEDIKNRSDLPQEVKDQF